MSEASEEETEVGVLIAAKDRLLSPFYKVTSAATSKTAQRAYLNTFLIVGTSAALLATAVVAYIIFYFSYVPSRGISKPVYLQFGPNKFPHGSATLSGALVSYQPYDVKVVLHMPRTPSNKAAGNFMIDLQLLASGSVLDNVLEGKSNVLAEASRPAILTYHSFTMEQVNRAAALPLYLIGWREEAETLKVGMMEGVEFSKGWRNIPEQARVELKSEEKLQIYSAHIEFTAKLRGLRYMMYNFKLTSFFVLTTIFWFTEMTFLVLVWISLSQYLSYESPASKAIKREQTGRVKQEIKDEEDMSDTPHTFPTLSGQPPLQYSSSRVKQEEEDVPAEQQPPFAEQADDEDDEPEYIRDASGRGVSDSGIGTSMDSSGGRPGSIRRRTSRTLKD